LGVHKNRKEGISIDFSHLDTANGGVPSYGGFRHVFKVAFAVIFSYLGIKFSKDYT